MAKQKTAEERKRAVQYMDALRLRNPEKWNADIRKWTNAKKYNRKRAEWRRTKHKLENAARKYLWECIKKGRIVRPSICEECKRECKPQGHHPDYSKKLEVRWLCRACHLKMHGYQIRVVRPGDAL